MNNFPEWWDADITLYNKHVDTTTRVVKWYKTTLSNCFWKYVGSQVQIGSTILDSAKIVCRIPKHPKFLPANQWLNLPNDCKADYFTLQQDDIICLGNIPDQIDEYKAGTRSTDLMLKYKNSGCIHVQDFSINTHSGMLSPHYKVGGK